MTTLPDFLANETYEVILKRLLGMIPSNIDKSEGSYIFDALSAVAMEIVQIKIDMQNYLSRGFASTTFETYLDARCEEHGLSRRAAVAASGVVTFTGVSGVTIPKGTIIATLADNMLNIVAIEFTTQAEATIPETGSIDIAVVASIAGESGNVLAGKITILGDYVFGVKTVTNSAATTGGEEAEDDTTLLERFLFKVRNPGTSGNKADYINWSLDVAGVGAAKVLPIWNGPGTVKVVVIDSDKQPANSEIVLNVTKYIEERRPIGATVTVESANGLSINVSAAVTLASGAVWSTIQSLFDVALTTYLKRIAFKQSYVSYAQIGNLLLDIPGVLDYNNLILNGSSSSNVAVGDTQVAIKGTVSLNE